MKKTLVFSPEQRGKKNFFCIKKKYCFFIHDLLVFCTLKEIHIFAQTFIHNEDLQ